MDERPIAAYGQWDVYPGYIECARTGYCLTRAELEARGAAWWDAHMAGKRWVKLGDFVAAREVLARQSREVAA